LPRNFLCRKCFTVKYNDFWWQEHRKRSTFGLRIYSEWGAYFPYSGTLYYSQLTSLAYLRYLNSFAFFVTKIDTREHMEK
jgi:hypothetical protein